MKVTGKGGSIRKNGVLIADVKSFTFSESDGVVYGQKQSDTAVTIGADSIDLPLRHGDMFDLVLGVSGEATWVISVSEAEVQNPSISVDRGAPVTQSLSFVSYITADFQN